MNGEDWTKLFIGILIGLFIAYVFLWGEPYSKLEEKYNTLNSDYNQLNEDYKNLLIDYQKLKEENEAIQEDVSKLLIDYYGKELVWNLAGISKYKRAMCALKIVLRGEIPFVNLIPC